MSKFNILAFRFLTDVLNLLVLAAAMIEVATPFRQNRTRYSLPITN